MLPEDKENLKRILMYYSSKEVMRELSVIAMDAADDLSDNGLKDQAKDMVRFSVSLDELICGRPFLV